jgi:hypothetical protein
MAQMQIAGRAGGEAGDDHAASVTDRAAFAKITGDFRYD